MSVHKFNTRLVEIEYKNGAKGTISLPYVFNIPLIKYYLQANKMPLTKFCDKAEIDYFRFNDFMNGERPSVDFFEADRISRYLKIPMDWLFLDINVIHPIL